MVDQQNPKIVRVRVGADVKAVQVERTIALDTRKVRCGDPFNALLDPSGAAGVEDGEAIEETTACGVEETNTARLVSCSDISDIGRREGIRRQPLGSALGVGTCHVQIASGFMQPHILAGFEA